MSNDPALPTPGPIGIAEPRAGVVPHRLEQVLADYLLAVEAGAIPDQAGCIERHPELAEELRAFFATEAQLRRLTGPLLPARDDERAASNGGTSHAEAAHADPSDTFTQDDHTSGPSGIGTRLGDYELLEEIGRGGMGIVYKARQLSVGRLVAVKMILAGQFASVDDVKRFEVEARHAGVLDHPNIVPIFDVGRWRGRHYFSMKLVEGRSLAHQIGSYADDEKRIAGLLLAVARAVHHAHERGVLHRDLKPGNILIDGSGQPQVTDFGLARHMHDDGPGLTLSGMVLGSPRYMAPEQAGSARVLTVAADIYALGSIMYELLTGRTPFAGETVLETLRQVREEQPRRPRTKLKRIDRDLETVCLKCLEKDPARRYTSARALAEDLERWLAGTSISARPSNVWQRGVRWVRRKPARAALLACALVLAFTAGGFAYHAEWSRRQLTAARLEHAIERALVAAMNGEWGKVDETIKSAELLGAPPWWVRMLKGQQALQRGNAREAVSELEQAAKLNSRSVAARAMLCLAVIDDGDGVKAEAIYNELAGLTAETAEDFLFKGKAQAWFDQEDAVGSLNEAVRLRPSSPVALLARAQASVRRALDTGDAAVAARAVEDARLAERMLSPSDTGALAVVANIHLDAGWVFHANNDEARHRAEMAAADARLRPLIPQWRRPAVAQAQIVYFMLAAQDDERHAFLKQFDDDGLGGFPVTVYLKSLYQRGQFAEALAVTDRELGRAWRDDLELDKGIVMLELPGRRSEVQELYRSRQARAREGTVLIYDVVLLLLMGENERARQHALMIKASPPRMVWRGAWNLKLNDYYAGVLSEEQFLREAGVSKWNRSDAFFAIGLTHLADGDRPGAEAYFRKVVEINYLCFERDWAAAFLGNMKDANWPQWVGKRSDEFRR